MESIRERFFYKCDSLFDDIKPQYLDVIQQNGIEKTFKKNKILFKQGSFPDGVYYIKKGKIKVYQLNPDGKSQIIYLYIKGEYFGFRPIISSTLNPVSAETIEDTVVVFYPKDVFSKILNLSPVLMKNLLMLLSYEFNIWVNLMSAFSQKSVKTRVALALLIFQEKYKKSELDKTSTINISRQDLASFAGTTIETCVRVLTNFKDEEIISSEGRKIKILKQNILLKLTELY